MKLEAAEQGALQQGTAQILPKVLTQRIKC